MSDSCRDAFTKWWKIQPWTSPKRKEAALEAWIQAWITRPSRPVLSPPTDIDPNIVAHNVVESWLKDMGTRGIGWDDIASLKLRISAEIAEALKAPR